MIKYSLLLFAFFSTSVLGFSCEQSASVPLEKSQEQTTVLSEKFTHIFHIEVLPHEFAIDKNKSTLKTVQILICGELIPVASDFGTVPGAACKFDSGCQAPMRCQNNVCALPA